MLGDNNWGQLGDGTTTQQQVAVRVSGVSGATAIAAGVYSTCAVVGGGAGAVLGLQLQRPTGRRDNHARLTAVTVVGVSGATAIAAGGSHACALVSGGLVQCWGNNLYGQLGDGTTTRRLTAVTVSGVSGATAIAAGENHTCALMSGGAVQCWGIQHLRATGGRHHDAAADGGDREWG
jgi:alpha-tubulin suppressor-like RCC1 family protein